jgi:hypothetical protein
VEGIPVTAAAGLRVHLSSGRAVNCAPVDGARCSVFDEMLKAYEGLVDRVVEGYGETVYEYGNDRACRDWLALAWPLFTESVRQSRTADLAAVDDRFRAATADDGGRSLGRFFDVESREGRVVVAPNRTIVRAGRRTANTVTAWLGIGDLERFMSRFGACASYAA